MNFKSLSVRLSFRSLQDLLTPPSPKESDATTSTSDYVFASTALTETIEEDAELYFLLTRKDPTLYRFHSLAEPLLHLEREGLLFRISITIHGILS